MKHQFMKPSRTTHGAVKDTHGIRLKSSASAGRAMPLDPMDIPLRLGELAKLQEGWLDGKGRPAKKEKLDWLADSFGAWFDTELPLPYLDPTAEGGVQAEWSLNDWEVSLEIDLESQQGAYQALHLIDSTCTESTFSLRNPEGWGRLNEALRQLASRKVEERPRGR